MVFDVENMVTIHLFNYQDSIVCLLCVKYCSRHQNKMLKKKKSIAPGHTEVISSNGYQANNVTSMRIYHNKCREGKLKNEMRAWYREH